MCVLILNKVENPHNGPPAFSFQEKLVTHVDEKGFMGLDNYILRFLQYVVMMRKVASICQELMLFSFVTGMGPHKFKPK